jgi:hypothetical protein
MNGHSAYCFQFRDQENGHWETVELFPSRKAAETATDEFGLLLTEKYDEIRIVEV